MLSINIKYFHCTGCLLRFIHAVMKIIFTYLFMDMQLKLFNIHKFEIVLKQGEAFVGAHLRSLTMHCNFFFFFEENVF